MDTNTFAAWVAALGKAWETKDAAAAADLFAEDATYQEDSFAPPMRGRDAIRAYWADVPLTQEDIAFAFEVIAVSGDLGIAHWWCSLTRKPSGSPVRLDGVFVVSFDAQGRGQTFREWWQIQE
jgi:ketosteroid isomerase-like protein